MTPLAGSAGGGSSLNNWCDICYRSPACHNTQFRQKLTHRLCRALPACCHSALRQPLSTA